MCERVNLWVCVCVCVFGHVCARMCAHCRFWLAGLWVRTLQGHRAASRGQSASSTLRCSPQRLDGHCFSVFCLINVTLFFLYLHKSCLWNTTIIWGVCQFKPNIQQGVRHFTEITYSTEWSVAQQFPLLSWTLTLLYRCIRCHNFSCSVIVRSLLRLEYSVWSPWRHPKPFIEVMNLTFCLALWFLSSNTQV